MKCPKCHIENPNDNKFCRGCGTATAVGLCPMQE
ncbi:zinc-ribbon domain-containing protein [Candidatus Saccharibacteria bacterium]|nr:zinc-ribbon domain-containing protein [Candidatus Saccharibacteria bacterium]